MALVFLIVVLLNIVLGGVVILEAVSRPNFWAAAFPSKKPALKLDGQSTPPEVQTFYVVRALAWAFLALCVIFLLRLVGWA